MNKITIILLLAALIYTRAELNETNQNLTNLQARYIDQQSEIDAVYELSKSIDQETLNTIERVVTIYDGNVEVYNDNFTDIYARLTTVENGLRETASTLQKLINILQEIL